MAIDLVPGMTLAGRFRLDRLLGEGGMGQVWAARSLDGPEVAIKLVREAVESPEARRRLLREARAASAVRHPNVVGVQEIVELEGGSPALVMQLLQGEPLAARLRREQRLSVTETAQVLLPVVSAVGTAHALGIIHRDLKPENIFLADVDGVTAIMVLDFGIAKLTAKHGVAAVSTDVTATGGLLGTPAYMAPEQVFGEVDADHRVDIWAIGLIAYRCLSGVLPTDAENIGQVLKAILSEPIAPLAKVAPEVPAPLAALVERMLARDRSQRPIDLREVLQALRPYADVKVPEFGPATVRDGAESSRVAVAGSWRPVDSAREAPGSEASPAASTGRRVIGGTPVDVDAPTVGLPARAYRMRPASFVGAALALAFIGVVAVRVASSSAPNEPAARPIVAAPAPSAAALAPSTTAAVVVEPLPPAPKQAPAVDASPEASASAATSPAGRPHGPRSPRVTSTGAAPSPPAPSGPAPLKVQRWD